MPPSAAQAPAAPRTRLQVKTPTAESKVRRAREVKAAHKKKRVLSRKAACEELALPKKTRPFALFLKSEDGRAALQHGMRAASLAWYQLGAKGRAKFQAESTRRFEERRAGLNQIGLGAKRGKTAGQAAALTEKTAGQTAARTAGNVEQSAQSLDSTRCTNNIL